MAEGEDVNVNLAEIIPTDMSSVAEIEIPSLADQSNEATPTMAGKRKRQSRGPHESKDPNAPRRPQTAYMMFTSEVRKDVRVDNPETSVSDRAKIISRMWAELDEEKKKVYQEKAQEDKERYIQEYVAYQETDSYKEFIRKKFPTLSKKAKTDDEKSGSSGSSAKTTSAPAKVNTPTGKTPLSCQQQYVPGLNIPIFSDEFLKHNREMESKLRKLRQSSSNLEEENALLSRHVDSMKSAVLRVQNEVKKQEEKNGNLQKHLVMLREILVNMFKEVPLPGTGELPTVDTIDNYMGKLQLAISSDPDKYPDLLVKVAEIAKQLETVLKPRLEEDGLSISATEEGGGASEDGQ